MEKLYFGMPPERSNRIISYYNRLLSSHRDDYKIVGWGSKASQEMRFDVMTQVGELEGHSVLDVGCGLGNLLGFLRQRNIHCDYNGVDIHHGMIDEARRRFPDTKFEVSDILELKDPLPQYDYVLLSGALNLSQDGHGEFMKAIVGRLFGLARRAAAFNVLSVFADFFSPGEFYANPIEVLKYCFSFTRKVSLRHDYLPHDFTVFLYKDT